MTAQKRWIDSMKIFNDKSDCEWAIDKRDFPDANPLAVCLWSEHEKDCEDAYKRGYVDGRRNLQQEMYQEDDVEK